MINFVRGSIFDFEAEAFVNSVNCVGVMGRGIALQFKTAFPDNFEAYSAACNRGEVQPGSMFVFDSQKLTLPRYIINFPTKRHWRGKSHIEDIKSGLEALVTEIKTRNIKSIAIPPLGSGLGGLEWEAVRPLIERALTPLTDVNVLVFEPGGGPVESKANHSREITKMTPGRASLVALIGRYLRGLLDPSITLLEIHKLMYFLQESGEPLKLRYVKALYGPYAENLRHVLGEMEGHLISGYVKGDAPETQLSLVPGADQDADDFLDAHDITRMHLEHVTELVQGFESPFGLELLSTVHWVMIHDNVSNVDDVVRATYAWNERKQKFSPAQIQLAIGRLKESGWLSN